MAEKKEKRYVSDNAQLMTEWDWERNNSMGLNPSLLLQYSNKRAWWKCNCGHSWEASIAKRTVGRGCPFCSGKKILQGYNDLATTNPELLEEWDYNKNKEISPKNVSKGSTKKVWWKCRFGHLWQAVIYSRAVGVGCPICSKGYQTSYPEMSIYFYISKMFPDAVSSYKLHENNGMELDIFIPSFKICCRI